MASKVATTLAATAATSHLKKSVLAAVPWKKSSGSDETVDETEDGENDSFFDYLTSFQLWA